MHQEQTLARLTRKTLFKHQIGQVVFQAGWNFLKNFRRVEHAEG